MTDSAKAKMTIGNGTIELEGSEEFVSKYLDSFRSFFGATGIQNPPKNSTESKKTEPAKDRVPNSSKSDKRSRKKVKSIEAEKFDIFKSGESPSLEEFLKQKSPGKTVGNVIAVIAYYIQQIKKLPYFTEGQIDYAYKALSITGRPTHLRQIIINKKNKNLWFEETEDNLGWKLTRPGEIFVEEKLPPQDGTR